MGFGGSSLGSTPFGAGPGASVLEAVQVTRNRVRVLLSPDARARNRGAIWDALYDRGWSLEGVSLGAGTPPRVVWVERDPDVSGAVLLHLDAPLAGPGELYTVHGSERAFGTVRAASFHTFGEASAAQRARRTSGSFDLANPQTGRAGPGEEIPLGTLSLEADGDYRNDGGIENLKKRIARRLSTPLGSFKHLPEYGLRVQHKGTVTVGKLRDLQTQATRQVRLELGVSDVQVEVSTPLPGIVRLRVRVAWRGGGFDVQVDTGE